MQGPEIRTLQNYGKHMKELLIRIASVLGKRDTRSRKENFAHFFIDKLLSMKYPVDMISDKKGRSGNIVIGDLKNAKAVFIAGYDTGKNILIPHYRYYPLSENKNMKSDIIDLVIRIALAALIFVVYFLVIRRYQLSKLWMTVLIVFTVLLMFLVFRGISTPCNFNRNTVSIVLLYELLEKVYPKDYAVIYADNTCGPYYGLQYLLEKCHLKNKEVIFLDCLLSDDKLQIIGKNEDAVAKKLISSFINTSHQYRSSPSYFENSSYSGYDHPLLLTGAKEENSDFVVYGTRSGKDSSVSDVHKLDVLLNELIDFVKTL